MKSLFLPHATWFQSERMSEYERVRYFFSSQEWLSFMLGANPVSVLPAEAYRPYYWDDVQCRIIGLDIEKFPPFVKLGSIIGRVSLQATHRFKLPAGIPIIAGGSDFIMALIGVGAISEGLVCDRAGTSEGINLCSAVPLQTNELRVLPHVVDGLWNIGGLIPDSGRLFDQYRAHSGQEQRDYDDLLRELIPDPAHAVSDTGGDHTLSLGRSTLETIGFKARAVLEKFRRHGLPLTEMRVSGGQSKNARWNQLKADVTGTTLLIPEVNDGELAGDAILAARALGEVSSLSEAVERMLHFRTRFTPNPRMLSLYTERYHAWSAIVMPDI
jgi:xylulokinase